MGFLPTAPPASTQMGSDTQPEKHSHNSHHVQIPHFLYLPGGRRSCGVLNAPLGKAELVAEDLGATRRHEKQEEPLPGGSFRDATGMEGPEQ